MELKIINNELVHYYGDEEEIVIPEGVTRICRWAFLRNKKINKISLPKSLEIIDEFSFEGCEELRNIEIKSNKVRINATAFKNCSSLKTEGDLIVFGNTIYGYNGSDGNLIIPNHVTEIAERAFWDNIKIRSVRIHDKVKCVPLRAFMDCKNLEKISLNEGLIRIEELAFAGCEMIEDIEIPDTVEHIGNYAFAHCYKLNNIILPDSIEELSEGMLSGCTKLESLNFNKISTIKRFALSATGFQKLDLSETNIQNIQSFAFDNAHFKSLKLGDNNWNVADYAFTGCRNLKQLYIDDEVITCGNNFIDSDVPYLHISAKNISSLGEKNKFNAVKTFISEQCSYSALGQKDWKTYIKRQKNKLLEECLAQLDIETAKGIIKIVDLTDFEKKNLYDLAINKKNKDFAELIKIDRNDKKIKKKSIDNNKIIHDLIDATPKTASHLKVVELLEAATLLGTVNDIKSIISKYEEPEYTKQAILEAIYLGDYEKLRVIVKSSTKGYIYTYNPPLIGKYGRIVERPLMDLLVSKDINKLIDYERIKEFINKTFRDDVNIGFPKTGEINRADSLLSLIKADKTFSISKFINAAFLNENYELMEELMKRGYHIDKKDIPVNIGYTISRRICHIRPQILNKILNEYAYAADQKIKLDDKSMYSAEEPLIPKKTFEIICSKYNLDRFVKKNLIEAIVKEDSLEHLKIGIKYDIVKMNRANTEKIRNLVCEYKAKKIKTLLAL